MRALRPHCEVIPVVRTGSWISDQLKNQGIDHHCLRFGGHLDFVTRLKLSRLVSEQKPDIVQTWMNRASRHFPRDRDVKWICRLGGYYNLKNYHGADQLIGNTEDICRYIINEGWPANRVACLPNFVDCPRNSELRSKAALRVSMGIPPNVIVLFSAGRFHQNKGFDLVLDVLQELPENVHFLLVGEGPERAELISRCEEFGLRARVHIFGWADDVTPYAKASDIWVVPSRIEPLGNVVIESWAHKIPVIASDASGPKSLIKHRQTGLLFNRGSIVSLRREISSLVQDPQLREKIADEGEKHFRAKFSEEEVISQWLQYFKKILSDF